MKILHITAFALRGGCEKNCYHFCNGKKDATHEIIVLDNPGPMTEAWREIGVPVEHLNIITRNLIAFGRELKKTLHGRQYNLVILWSTIRLPLQLNALNDVTKEVRVYLGNPLMPDYSERKDSVLQFVFPHTANVKLMACSAYVAKSHESDGYFGEFPMQVSLNPVALPDAFPTKTLNPSEFSLGMVARLDPIKDHKTVLLAFKDIIKHIPEARLHLVGDGVLRGELEKSVEADGLQRVITFHGDVDNVYQHLNSWDVFVYATTMQEGLGSVVAEAMANGMASVLSDLPMLRELAPHDDLVLWFEAGVAQQLADQTVKLYRDKALRHRLEENSFAYAGEHFGVQRFIQDYLN